MKIKSVDKVNSHWKLVTKKIRVNIKGKTRYMSKDKKVSKIK